VVCDELRGRGAEVTLFDARNMALSFPGQEPTADAVALKAAVEECTGVILATPEYHGSFSSMSKLIIENLGFPSVLAKKPIALVGVAAGRIGAIKSLEQLRGICAHVGAVVVPGAVSVAGVRAAFTADGICTDAGTEAALRGDATGLMDFVRDYVCPKYTLEAMIRGESTPWTANL
jgi:chromate reductase, NAD(P)H dehydrogenase (quinone)